MKKSKHTKSLSLAIIFFTIFTFLILISITVKVINIFQKSSFYGENHYTVEVLGENEDVSLVTLAPKSNALYILNIKEGKDKNLRTALEIPIDGEIKSNISIDEKNVRSSFIQFLTPFKIEKTNLTVVDLFRISIFVNSVPVNSIYQKNISVNDDLLNLKNLGVYSFFVDQIVAEEKISIEIVNGTDVFGLANKLASYISNMGGNVVMVSTSDKLENESRIDYVGEENYTLRKISKILNFKVNKVNKKGLADLKIIIGKDALKDIKF